VVWFSFFSKLSAQTPDLPPPWCFAAFRQQATYVAAANNMAKRRFVVAPAAEGVDMRGQVLLARPTLLVAVTGLLQLVLYQLMLPSGQCVFLFRAVCGCVWLRCHLDVRVVCVSGVCCVAE